MKIYNICALLSLLLFAPTATAKVNVVTSTSDLAYFARAVGGDLVKVKSLALPTADLHYVEVRPSHMLKVKKADVVLKIGLGLDLWMDKIIDGSRNSDLNIVDCSKNIEPLEVLTFKPDARYGDLHQFGNPHYWLTPDNVAPITLAILDGLVTADPENAEEYRTNRAEYLDQLESSMSEIKEEAEFLKGQEVIFYHNSWPYFNAFTGLVPAAFIEPYPGVPASPSHIAEVIHLVRNRAIRVIIMEPFFDRRVPEKIAAETGAKVVIVYPSVGGRNKEETYVQWLKGNIDALKGVLQ